MLQTVQLSSKHYRFKWYSQQAWAAADDEIWLMLKCCERKTLFHGQKVVLNKLKRSEMSDILKVNCTQKGNLGLGTLYLVRSSSSVVGTSKTGLAK